MKISIEAKFTTTVLKQEVEIFLNRSTDENLSYLISYLADILWEAVPRARRPKMHNPKHSVTRGESFSLSTGYRKQQVTLEVVSCYTKQH